METAPNGEKRSRKNQKKKITKKTYGTNIFEDDAKYVAERKTAGNKTESEILRDLVAKGILYEKVKNNGFDEVSEHFKNQLNETMNNIFRPLRKQIDELGNKVEESSENITSRADDLATATSEINQRLGSIGNLLEKLQDQLAERKPETAPALLDNATLDAIKELKLLSEHTARNMIGIRVVVWLYLFEIMTPLVKTYANINRKDFNELLKAHVERLFNTDTLKEIAHLKAGEIESFIQKEVINVYKELRDQTTPK